MVRRTDELRELNEDEKNLLERLVRIADANIDQQHVPGSSNGAKIVFPSDLYPLSGVILNHLRREYDAANWEVAYGSTGLTNKWGLVWASNVMYLTPKPKIISPEQSTA